MSQSSREQVLWTIFPSYNVSFHQEQIVWFVFLPLLKGQVEAANLSGLTISSNNDTEV